MRAIVWLIVIFALAAGLSLVASHNTGYVLLVSSPYRVQLSLNLFICLLIGSFVAGYFLVRLIRGTLRLPGAVGRMRAQRRKDGAQRNLRDSLRLFLEGRYAQSLKQAAKAYRSGESEGLSALMAARAAHEMRDEARYQEWIEQASKVEEIRTARLMTEAELALDGRRFGEASRCLEALRERGERHIAAQRLALRAAQSSGRWEETARLARQLKKHKAMSAEASAAIVRRAHLECLKERAADPAALTAYWNAIPSAEGDDRLLLERAVPILVGAGKGGLARRLVEDLLTREWESGLARSYADCCVEQEDVAAALVKAEGWLKTQPRDAGLLLTLGRLCMRMKLWGKAQSYFEASLSIAPEVQAYLALARLSEELQRPADAQNYYRKAAELAAR